MNQGHVKSNQVKPQRLERIDDGEIFSLNSEGTYSMDSSAMRPRYTYTLEHLMGTKAFRIIG